MASFFIYDMIFLVAFSLFVFIFLYKRRAKLQREGLLFLYRTQVGVKIINYIGKKYAGLLRFLEYLVIATGYILMIAMIYVLVNSVKIFLNPLYVQAIRIPPLAPLIPYLPEIFKVSFLPPFYFTYWIIALAIVAISHEFSHGIFAKLHNIKIKSTGFGFLGPFLAAFVEPDEKKMQKLKRRNQISILSAGTFANVIMTVIFFLLMWLFFFLSFSASGAVFDTYLYSAVNKSDISGFGSNISVGGANFTQIFAGNLSYFVEADKIPDLEETFAAYGDYPAIRAGLAGAIISINGEKVSDYESLGEMMKKYSPGDSVNITTVDGAGNEQTYEIGLVENPGDKTRAFVGIGIYQERPSIFGKIRSFLTFFKDKNTHYAPDYSPDFVIFIYNLLWWIVLINISVALVNMLPVGIFDGGRVFYLTMLYLFSEKTSKILFKIASYLILGIFLLLMILWAVGFF